MSEPEAKLKTERVTIRVTLAEHARLMSVAAEMQRTLSGAARLLLIKGMASQ